MIDEKPILFGPVSGKHLGRMYPEVNEEPIFSKLTQEDLNFAWYMGCPSSPVDPDWSDQVRRGAAAEKTIKDKKKREKYVAGDIPEEVKAAIIRFSHMAPDARLVAKRMVQNMFINLRKIMDIDVDKAFNVLIEDENEPGKFITVVDWAKKKQYVEMIAKTSDTLPNLIKQLEEGFGMTDTKEDKEKIGTKTIDMYHSSKKQ